MVLVVRFHLFIEEFPNTAVQERSAATVGVQQRKIMMLTSSGDSVIAAFCLTVAIQMETAAIFHSYTAGKHTQLARLRMKPSPGAPQHTTMTSTNSGVTAEVRKTRNRIANVSKYKKKITSKL